MKIKISGTIVPDDYADVYEYFGIAYTSPGMIELPASGREPLDVEINSYGGDVYSGSEIYTKLKSYPGIVTVTVTGIAASIASVIAMAGDVVRMSPTAQMMIHNVSAVAEGDKDAMSKESEILSGYDQTIANAYRIKTGQSEAEILALMSAETWLTPQAALESGFCDEILFFDQLAAPLLVAAQGATVLPREEITRLRAEMEHEKMKKTQDEIKEETEEPAVENAVNMDKASEPISEPTPEIALQNANDKALEGVAKMAALKDEAINKKITVIERTENMNKGNDYRTAFLNYLLGGELKGNEAEIFDAKNREFGNVFTHDTTNTSVVIPETTEAMIWSRAARGYAVFADVKRMSVRGDFRIIKHTGITAGDAAWYKEATATADEQNAFGELKLSGKELSKAVTISWKLKSMALDDFEAFLVRELGDRMAAALGTGVIRGTGVDAPRGIIPALLAQSGTPQIAKIAGKEPTYKDVTAAMAKLDPAYISGAALYANNKTIWTALANILDAMGRPLFVASVMDNGVGNIFGLPVKEDASLDDNEVLIGNPGQGYVFNVQTPISITTEDHAKQRATDYVSYTVADGGVLDEAAFVLLICSPEKPM